MIFTLFARYLTMTLKNICLFCAFAAKDVACLRPSLSARAGKQLAPGCQFSSGQSVKLHSLLTNLYGVGGYSHTFGALDTVQVTQMAPHLSSIYVSGWQCSSTASTTNEPGPDFADYPMNTVPNKVDQLIRAQMHHDRRQNQERSAKLLAGQDPGRKVDYLVPIVADGDTGTLFVKNLLLFFWLNLGFFCVVVLYL